MNKVIINWENISDYSSVPIEYRFIDRCEVIPGKEAIGTKMVSSLDWYFKFHFPGNPIVPGVFLMEALQQTGLLIITTMPAEKGKIMLFQGCKSMRIYRPVRPGDIIKAYVSLLTYRCGVASFHGELKKEERDGERLACAMDFTLVSQEGLVKVRKGCLGDE